METFGMGILYQEVGGSSQAGTELLINASLLLISALYAWGVYRNWKAAGVGHGLRWGQVIAFAGGMITLAVALSAPVDELVDGFFAVHMTQHMLLFLLAAPLLALGAAPQAFAWAVGRKAAGSIARALGENSKVRSVWQFISGLWASAILFAIALWFWHTPMFYQAAVESNVLHAIEHFSFLLTATLMWWALINDARRKVRGGTALATILFTMLHMALLGVLISTASAPIYADYVGGELFGWHLTAMSDQLLAGLIMFIPGGAVYLPIILFSAIAWMEESEKAREV